MRFRVVVRVGVSLCVVGAALAWSGGIARAQTAATASGAAQAAHASTPQAPAKKPAAASKKPAATTSKIPSFAPLVNRPEQAWEERYVTVPFIGKVNAYVPKHAASTHVVLFISGDGGWALGVVDMARRIADRTIVIGISYPALRRAQPETQKCWFPAGDAEEISHAAQKELGLPEYHAPILLGYSSGATLVYGLMVEAPPETFAGGMSLGFCPDLPSNHHVCDAGDWKPTYDVKINSAMLPKVASVPHDWYILLGVEDQVCNPAAMHQFLDDMKNAHLIDVPHSGHGFSNEPRWGPPFDDSIKKLLEADTKPSAAPKPATASAAAMQTQLDALGLPLSYEWAASPRAALVFVSGDGGWATLDKSVASYLAARGVSVVGMSTLEYFWKKKTPEQTGADLRRIADVLDGSHLPLFVGGYSFGAEVTPFALASWPDVRRRVAGEILIAPGETASWEMSPLDWIRTPGATTYVVARQVKQLNVPTFCLTGDKTPPSDTACDDMKTFAECQTLPGTHHFNSKYDDVGRVAFAFIEKRLKP